MIASGQTKAIKIPAGKSVDLWLGVNVTGSVFYAIRTRDGKNQVRMWWILQPLGRVKQLGIRSHEGSLDIPSSLDGVASAKLRASATADTVIYVQEKVAVDKSVTFRWP